RYDRVRLEQHSDEIRDLERRLASLSQNGGSGACQQFADPGPDPAVGARSSNETLRNRVFMDLIHMAFTCDMTRVATLMLTTPQCHLDVTNLDPRLVNCQDDQHDLGHLSGGVPSAPAGT